MGKWRKTDWIWFGATWLMLALTMLVIDHFGKLAAEPKFFWIIFFPAIMSWLRVIRDKIREED